MKDFEKKLERLEAIHSAIREQSVSLDESLALFEEGMNLARELEKALKQITRKVEILTSGIADEEEPVFTEMESGQRGDS